eukprot:COSAG03_NODE_27198_length_254_cov_1.341935_1_plen_71_part_10
MRLSCLPNINQGETQLGWSLGEFSEPGRESVISLADWTLHEGGVRVRGLAQAAQRATCREAGAVDWRGGAP